MRTIKISQPYINQDTIASVVKVLESGWLTQGPVVAEFEQNFKKYVSSQHALAITSATAGLHMALLSLGIGAGDEVIVPSFTWVATANAVELCGAKSVFVDINLDTFNANEEQILENITTQTKAIIVVHLFGKPFDVGSLKAKLPRVIPIIEDAACAAGAMFNQQHCGTVGDIGVYSFHPRKSITTGEGGMVVTNNVTLYNRMNMLRNHGQDTSYKEDSISAMFDCPIVGLNYRMTDFQAALGVEQLKLLDHFINERNVLASRYAKRLDSLAKIKVPCQTELERHSWQSYVIYTEDAAIRDHLMLGLKKHGIETRPGTHAVHNLKYFKDKYKYNAEDIPIANKALKGSIALPLHNHMSIDDVDYIADKLIEVLDAGQ